MTGYSELEVHEMLGIRAVAKAKTEGAPKAKKAKKAKKAEQDRLTLRLSMLCAAAVRPWSCPATQRTVPSTPRAVGWRPPCGPSWKRKWCRSGR